MLVAALLLFICALHTVIYARTSWLLVVAIVTAEWCHIPALIGFVLAAITWRRGPIGRIAAITALTRKVVISSTGCMRKTVIGVRTSAE